LREQRAQQQPDKSKSSGVGVIAPRVTHGNQPGKVCAFRPGLLCNVGLRCANISLSRGNSGLS
jgi:hypothetical protein